jgi:hypothetical protein
MINQQVEGLQAHRNAVRQTGQKLSHIHLSRRRYRMVDLMSLDPNSTPQKYRAVHR